MSVGVSSAWAVEVGIIAVRDLAKEKRPPLPSELLSSFIVFGGLSMLSVAAPVPAGLVAWGLVVATVISSQVDFLGPVGTFISGKSPTAKP